MSKKITLTIDGVKVKASEGATVLEAALENGVYIPHLCYHPDLEPAAVCRVCMVDIDGRLVTSCNTPVAEGMAVRTDTPEVNRVRRTNVELLIANHDGDCLQCFKNMECELQRAADYVGIDEERMKRLRRSAAERLVDTSNPFFLRDVSKCILCGICVRTCEELQGVSAIDFAGRGFEARVAAFGDEPIAESICESCGECVARCPVGALVPRNFEKPTREAATICTYCGCGCGVVLGTRGGRIVSARGDEENPVNKGSLCVKGRFAFGFVNHPQRLTTPLIRRDGELREASWDEALDLVVSKFAQYRGDRFATIASAKCTNEENYVAQKFTRAVMQTNNIDHCARL